MNHVYSHSHIRLFQWMFWFFVFLALTLSLLAMDGFLQALVYALLNTSFYALIIYGNISLLFPRLYQKGKKILYVLAVLVFLTGSGFIRAILTIYIYNAWFAVKPEPFRLKAVLSLILGGAIVLLLSFVFRIAIAYFALRAEADEIIVQKTHAELNMLKSQVQPHFLFNTLNNIYYEAYLEAPRTARLIEGLAEIMRYFVDESPKSLVTLSTEVAFLENYISLERIRIRHGVGLHFEKEFADSTLLPPMLLMTFVENIFKHGIDKTSRHNLIDLSLLEIDGWLLFSAKNTILSSSIPAQTNSFGLFNLKKRLELLYGNNFELSTSNKDKMFTATLKIPLP